MADKTIVLITGANTGIGYETVKAILPEPIPYTILMGGRSVQKVNDAITSLKKEFPGSKSDMIPIQVDVSSDESIEAAHKEVESKYGRVDVLVNNAGASFDFIMKEKPGSAGIREAWNKAYDTNVSGTQVLTTLFVPMLLKSKQPRLLFVTSGLSSLTTYSGNLIKTMGQETTIPPGWPKPANIPAVVAYRSSKVALNMMMVDWSKLLEADNVKVFSISPGFLATGLGGAGADNLKKVGAGEPSIGGQFIKDVVKGVRDADSGKVINRLNGNDSIQPW